MPHDLHRSCAPDTSHHDDGVLPSCQERSELGKDRESREEVGGGSRLIKARKKSKSVGMKDGKCGVEEWRAGTGEHSDLR